MGYCIEMTNCAFKIKKDNTNNVVTSLKQYVKDNPNLMWIRTKDVLNATTIDEIFLYN